jgi:glycosyltransferase involved in cell wall biosynthesis
MTSNKKLLVLGPMHPDQGVHLAIAVARMSGLPLLMAGEIVDTAYFKEQVEPHLDEQQIRYLGPLDAKATAELFTQGLVLLHLNTAPEQSGVVLSEAVAAGVPVIAMDLGLCREVVTDGVTGFLVDNVNQAVRALQRLPELSLSLVAKKL